jgi:hypothetical protein
MKPDIRKLTSDEMEWVIKKLPPAPSVFVSAYIKAGCTVGWRHVAGLTEDEFQSIEDIREYVLRIYPSTLAFEVCRKEKGSEK